MKITLLLTVAILLLPVPKAIADEIRPDGAKFVIDTNEIQIPEDNPDVRLYLTRHDSGLLIGWAVNCKTWYSRPLIYKAPRTGAKVEKVNETWQPIRPRTMNERSAEVVCSYK